MSTPFRYPNGEHIDIFLSSDKALLLDDLLLSDCGLTALYLRNAQVLLDNTSRRKELVADILSRSGVRLQGQQLTIRPKSAEAASLSEAIYLLSQICVRISDLATHARLRSSNPFKDDIEEFIESQGLRYQSDVKLPAVFGKRELRMDFEVFSGNLGCYVNVLSSLNDTSAHSSANEVAIKLVDLQRSGEVYLQRFVTVYNSQSSAFRPEDLERLQTMSNVVSYPAESETLADLLRDEFRNISVGIV